MQRGFVSGDAEAGEVLAGGGDMGARMRALDWSTTPLGPVPQWPQALKTSVRIMLTSRQPMFVWWGDQLINLYNDAYRDILQGKHPWALGRPADIVWQEIWDQVGPRAQAAMGGTEGTYDEALLLIMQRNGYPEETYYTFSYSPVPNDEGGTGGILCANTDDTQRIIGERQLVLLRTLASETAEARTVEDACRLSGVALATNGRDVPFAMIYLVDRAQQRATLAGQAHIEPGHSVAPTTVDLAGDAWPFSHAVLHASSPSLVDIPHGLPALPCGEWQEPPSRAVVAPLPWVGEGETSAVLIAALSPYRLFDANYHRFIDLTVGQIGAAISNAHAYQRERTRAEALAELDRAKTVFFSNVSHEFRTPLTLLLAPLEDLLAEGDATLSPAQREHVDVAHRNALRLLRLVNTLLDFSRIEAGRVNARYEPVDLASYTADLASTFRSAVERAGLRLVVDCPPLPPDVQVYIDREMWEKIVLNLLSNAFKFTFSGEITVRLHATADGRAVQLQVRDTGTGIPENELPHLFTRFHRVQGAAARTHEGTGIGLALVQELARLHGGTVEVESVLGAGSMFSITVPTGKGHLPPEQIGVEVLAPSMLSPAAWVEEAQRWLTEPAQVGGSLLASNSNGAVGIVAEREAGRRGRALLADDNADMRDYVTRLLRRHYDVEAVPDGEAALRAIHANPPDLVLSDVMMPRLDGFGVLRAIRQRQETRDIPVILLSARAGEEAQVEGLDAGADDYLVKPFSARELLARVGTHLSQARLRNEAARREQEARTEAELERSRLRHWLMQAPAAIAILNGPEHRFTLANDRYVRLVGRDPGNRTVREAFPELANQGIYELLDRVFTTGEPFMGNEMAIDLVRHPGGPLERGYFNFVYQPVRGKDGQVEGIFVHAVEVTSQVEARRQLEMEVAERLYTETLLAGERAVLEMIARGRPLKETLEALAHFIEAQSGGLLCSILLLDPDGVHLRHGAGPSLPEAYNRAIDGITHCRSCCGVLRHCCLYRTAGDCRGYCIRSALG